MNKNTTTTRLTDAQIHQLKYPKAVLVETDIFEKENLTEADYLALIDPEEINTIKKALGRTAYLSEALQKAEGYDIADWIQDQILFGRSLVDIENEFVEAV